VAGQVLTVDMKSSQTFSELTLDAAAFAGPAASYNVDVSPDNATWTNVITKGTGPASGLETISFPSHTARYIRITVESSASFFWSIAELNVWH
jgi:hypothetical protein